MKHAADVARIGKRVTCQELRHLFATHLLKHGYYIRTVQGLLGHKNVETTMNYTHVMSKPALGVRSPGIVKRRGRTCSGAVSKTRVFGARDRMTDQASEPFPPLAKGGLGGVDRA